MMPRANFRQADLERILRAAKKVGAVVHVDLRTLEVKISQAPGDASSINDGLVPDAPENWD